MFKNGKKCMSKYLKIWARMCNICKYSEKQQVVFYIKKKKKKKLLEKARSMKVL